MNVYAQVPENSTTELKQALDYTIYEFYFRRIQFFEKLATKSEKAGRSGSVARSILRKELRLTDSQRHILNTLTQVGSQALADAASVDAKAANIIEREHSQYRRVKLLKPPTVPWELKQLQESRNAIFKNAISRLSQQIDDTSFQQINSRIKAVILPKVSVGQSTNSK